MRARRVGRTIAPLIAAVLVIGFLFLAVFPTRTWLAQQDAMDQARARLALLDEENAALERRAADLQSDAEIERLARERYNLVRPGEEAFAVLPPPAPTTTTTTPAAPAGR
jgi:cell division protein FtsB